jgi:ligand-binding sensor domain-containing protein
MIILSLSIADQEIWATGPQGLFKYVNGWEPVPQPMQQPYCCAVVGKRVLVGGSPLGVAFRDRTGQDWKAGWMGGSHAAVLCLAPSPADQGLDSILAGTEGDGVLLSTDGGSTWTVSNFGLQNYSVLALSWAPQLQKGVWPAWKVAWAGTEEGLYRSPNGGLAWQRCRGPQGVILSISAALNFHETGLALAGAERDGLWLSTDGGRCFKQVNDAPMEINALAALPTEWLLSDAEGLLRSKDGLVWERVPNSRPAFTLLVKDRGVWAGSQDGVEYIHLPE